MKVMVVMMMMVVTMADDEGDGGGDDDDGSYRFLSAPSVTRCAMCFMPFGLCDLHTNSLR